jgi:Cytochrome P460
MEGAVNTKVKTLFAILLLAVAVVVVQSSSASVQQQEVIKGYREWTRVNPVPVDLPSMLARLCFAPTVKQIEMNAGDPHRDKFITVYVNDLGRKPMMHELKPSFPKGSVIVKEKLPSKESTAPELLTVMIKREKGYNPENGDWEYMALDGDGKEVRARGKLEKCQACHQTAKYND